MIVVHFADSGLELGQLVEKHSFTLGIADTVSVDNDIGGKTVFFFLNSVNA